MNGASSSDEPTVKRKTLTDILGIVASDLFSGALVAAVGVALAVSFTAVIFQGDLAGGFPTGLWTMLMSMVVIGLCVGLLTSLPPLAGGPDTPVVAMMAVLAGSVSAPLLAKGVANDLVVQHVLLAFSLMTLLSGVVLSAIGTLRLGQSLRFVPYPVMGGFLAATGCLLMMSSVKVVTGRAVSLAKPLEIIPEAAIPKVATAICFASALWLARKQIKSPLLLPVAFFGAAAALDALLWTLSPADLQSWFIQGAARMSAWKPISAAGLEGIQWPVLAAAIPEMATCVVVGLISLVVKLSSIESSRAAAANLDRELQANGLASLVGAPLGSMTGSVIVASSKLFLDAGARTQLAPVAASLITGAVIFAEFDLPSLVPKPILAGLLMLLGFSMFWDAVKAAFNQRSWLEIVLTLGIMGLCLWLGYVAGVIAGFVAACLLFAMSYSRIGVVRRHMTRASFAGGVERPAEAERLLRQHGDALHVYVLTGYVFFGSSEALCEQIRKTIETQSGEPVRFIVLDFTGVAGLDSSAVNTLAKLSGIADKRRITLVYAGLTTDQQCAFEKSNLIAAKRPHRAFATRLEAQDWCEAQLLQSFQPLIEASNSVDFPTWLSSDLGFVVASGSVDQYFNRRELAAGEILYSQGAPADSIDFIASGTVAISLEVNGSPPRLVRRATQQTILGEMGFFRRVPRGATIAAEGSVVVYRLSREALMRMRDENPRMYDAILHYIIRTLSDRVDLAHKEIAALG